VQEKQAHMKQGMIRALAVACCAMGLRMGAEAAVPLPYALSPSNAVDWTTLPGWSGNVTTSTAAGFALFDAGASSLTLALDGAPTSLSFSLRGYSMPDGVAPASFIVEQSADGGVWNATLVADISDEALSVATMPFGPYPLLGSTRYIRFTYADRYAYDIGLNHVAVDGGPAEPRVVFSGRKDGFIVAQHAEGESITAAVINAGGYWFGSEALEKEAWESDNGGTFKTNMPKDVYFINTSATGAFYATANGRADNIDEIVAGTIHFKVAPAYAIALQVGANGSATVQVNGREATNAPVGAVVAVLPVPNAGHATDSILVNGLAIEGTTFVMPDEAVVVEVVFRQKAPGEPTLIISQYYEGASNNKWIELFNPADEAVDLDAAGYRLGLWQNAAREGWKSGSAPAIATVLSGTIAPGATYLVSHGDAAAPAYAVANVASNGLLFNGDDSVVLYTGSTYNFANVVDAFGLTGNTAANCSYVRAQAVVSGTQADFHADDWIRFEYASVDAADANVPERLGWHAAGEPSPPVVPPVLSNLALVAGGLVFEIPTNITDYTVHGAAGLSVSEPSRWQGSNIADQCTVELAETHRRITVPMTFGPSQIIWLSVPGTN
jgi:hypothetical protein